jgi:hypothetical protein
MEISGDRVIIRERVAIMEDGVEVAHYFQHREIDQDQDISKDSEKIKAVVSAAKVK